MSLVSYGSRPWRRYFPVRRAYRSFTWRKRVYSPGRIRSPRVASKRIVSSVRKLNEILRVGDPILSGNVGSGYVSMPSFGTGYLERKSKFVLLKGIRLYGTYRVINSGGAVKDEAGVSMTDVGVERSEYDLHGVVTLFLVLDKKPRGETIPEFGDVFDSARGSSCVDGCPRNDKADRFELLIRRKVCLHGTGVMKLSSVECYCRPFRKIWVQFHDYGDGTRGGNYRNLASNALLYYVCFDSTIPGCCLPTINSCITF